MKSVREIEQAWGGRVVRRGPVQSGPVKVFYGPSPVDFHWRRQTWRNLRLSNGLVVTQTLTDEPA